MVAVDTNVLIRLLTKDDPAQSQKALRLFKNDDIFIADTVILETEWVLRAAYDYSAVQIVKAFEKLFGLANVHVSNAHLLSQIMTWYAEGLDFADAFHLGTSKDNTSLKTFDQKFIKHAAKLSACKVELP